MGLYERFGNRPVLFLLVGLPGAGKSTWIKNSLDADNYYWYCIPISTDEYIDKQARIQNKTYDQVFAAEIKAANIDMGRKLNQALWFAESIIWDQTNLSVKNRAAKLSRIDNGYKQARHYGPGYFKIAVVFECDEALRQERIKNRPGKTIPPHVDASMIESYEPPTLDEGFDEIWYPNKQ